MSSFHPGQMDKVVRSLFPFVLPILTQFSSDVLIASSNETISDKITLAGPSAFEVALPNRTWPSEGTVDGY